MLFLVVFITCSYSTPRWFSSVSRMNKWSRREVYFFALIHFFFVDVRSLLQPPTEWIVKAVKAWAATVKPVHSHFYTRKWKSRPVEWNKCEHHHRHFKSKSVWASLGSTQSLRIANRWSMLFHNWELAGKYLQERDEIYSMFCWLKSTLDNPATE